MDFPVFCDHCDRRLKVKCSREACIDYEKLICDHCHSHYDYPEHVVMTQRIIRNPDDIQHKLAYANLMEKESQTLADGWRWIARAPKIPFEYKSYWCWSERTTRGTPESQIMHDIFALLPGRHVYESWREGYDFTGIRCYEAKIDAWNCLAHAYAAFNETIR